MSSEKNRSANALSFCYHLSFDLDTESKPRSQSSGGSIRIKQISQILRGPIVEGFVNIQQNFKMDSIFNRKPVKCN